MSRSRVRIPPKPPNLYILTKHVFWAYNNAVADTTFNYTFSCYSNTPKENLWAFIGRGQSTGENIEAAIDGAENQICDYLNNDKNIVDILAKTEYAVLRDNVSKRSIWRHSQSALMMLMGCDPMTCALVQQKMHENKQKLASLAAEKTANAQALKLGAGIHVNQNEIDELAHGLHN